MEIKLDLKNQNNIKSIALSTFPLIQTINDNSV